MDETFQENNVAVEVLSCYKLHSNFFCAFIYSDKKQNRTSDINWHFKAII